MHRKSYLLCVHTKTFALAGIVQVEKLCYFTRPIMSHTVIPINSVSFMDIMQPSLCKTWYPFWGSENTNILYTLFAFS